MKLLGVETFIRFITIELNFGSNNRSPTTYLNLIIIPTFDLIGSLEFKH